MVLSLNYAFRKRRDSEVNNSERNWPLKANSSTADNLSAVHVLAEHGVEAATPQSMSEQHRIEATTPQNRSQQHSVEAHVGGRPQC